MSLTESRSAGALFRETPRAATRSGDDFAALVAPCTVDDFVRNHWEKKYLHVKRGNRSYYDRLLGLKDIENFLFNRHKLDESVRLVKDGKEISIDGWTKLKNKIDRVVDSDQIYSLFGQGVTIIINALEKYVSSVDTFCQHLERDLRFHLQANLYITPHDSQGFAPHYDTHDVMILQIVGSKAWKLYDSPVVLPCVAQRHDPKTYPLSAPEVEIELHQGDLLYLPRGLVHDAQTMNVGSMHITLGFYPTMLYDLFSGLVSEARNDPGFRSSLPVGLLGTEARGEFASRIKARMIEWIQGVDIERVLNSFDEGYLETERTDHRNRLVDLMRLADLNLGSRVARRKSVSPVVVVEGSLIKVQYAKRTLEFPGFLRSSLEIMLEDRPFAIHEIRGLINDAGKVELARKMIQEGVLEIVDLG